MGNLIITEDHGKVEPEHEQVWVTCADCGRLFDVPLWIFEVIVAEEGQEAEFWCHACSDPPPDRGW